jgi:hypothetical protein
MKTQLLAQLSIGGQKIDSPLVGINNIGDLVNRIMTFLIPIAGIILFLVIIWGGYDFMMSGGAPEKVKSGRAKITTGIIGFILLVLSYFFAKLIGTIFGLGGGIL